MKNSDEIDFRNCMQNRELSWLKFNERVLEESNYKGNPPFERLKYISIFCSNLDEFFMVRVGSLTDYMLYAPKYFDNKTGMTARQQLDAIFLETASLYALKDRYYQSLMEELNSHGVEHLKMSDLSTTEGKDIEKHFVRNIQPLLSPQIIDNRHHPFPHIENLKLYIAVTLEHKSSPLFGLIAVPKTLDRLFMLEGGCRYVLLEDLICHFSHLVFKPYKVLEKTILSVTRNADINVEQEAALDEDIDFRQFMQKLVKKRNRLTPVRLELQYDVSKAFRAFFYEKLNLIEKQVYLVSSPLDISYYFSMEDKLKTGGRKDLFLPAHIPYDVFPADKRNHLIKEVFKRDVFFSFPYESILPFLEMIRRAADDPKVLSIKITLYRLDFQSRLADALIRAAENGKEVIVLMELQARFDETNNIEWSVRLEEAGCRIIYGISGYKVHSKICLITRRESGKIQYITQIGTGNYNEKTVKLYTDFSLVTSNQEIGKDAVTFFNSLSLGDVSEGYEHLWVAPACYKQNIIRYIEDEEDKAKNCEDAQIIIKCNSLTDKEIIIKLIEASQSGVKISLIIRGICCLIPRIPEFTHNISVISIVGRFLEHTRVFCFGTGQSSKVYISSADLMTRNTERRIEIACPIYDTKIKTRICEMLDMMLKDNSKAWEHYSNGRYILRSAPVDMVVNSQEAFIDQARTDSVKAVGTPVRKKHYNKNTDTLPAVPYVGKSLLTLIGSLLKRMNANRNNVVSYNQH